MKDRAVEKNDSKKIVIKTKQGDVEISWPCSQNPGFCPHCHKCIPLNSIVFHKEKENSIETYSGMDAVKTRKNGELKEESTEHNTPMGECPYCHKPIPVREITLKKPGMEE